MAETRELAHTQPKTICTSRNGLGGNEVFRMFEDSRGDVWIGAFGSPERVLTRWDRATDKFQSYPEWRDTHLDVPTAFCEDAAGGLWIGAYWGGVARDAAGRFKSYSEADGLPGGAVHSLYLDRQGRLWVGCSTGLGRIDDPSSDHPQFITWSTGTGLSSNDIWCVTEDRWGRIYVGTGRGLDRLDASSGHVKQYTAADGLARSKVEDCFRDHEGALWFGTAQGLSRLISEPDKPLQPPPIVISQLRVAGLTRRISELGETEVPGFELGPNQNDIQIDLLGLSFGTGEVLRYQYRLEGGGGDWSAPGNHRMVTLASLLPGRYRFVVRADSDKPIRVAIVEDDRATREGLSLLVNGTPGYQCVGTFRSVEEARPSMASHRPDVLLLDIGLPGMLGSGGVHLLKQDCPTMEILMLTIYTEQDLVFESICSGASGYLLKKTPPAKLLEAIAEAHEGGAPLSPEIARKVVALFRKTGPPEKLDDQLTPQELRMLKLLSQGYSYQTAADRLNISLNTVRDHIRNIYEKLHVHSKSEAVSKALRNRLIF